MTWWPPKSTGDAAGEWVREFVRALFSFPDPHAATRGKITLQPTASQPAGTDQNEERET